MTKGKNMGIVIIAAIAIIALIGAVFVHNQQETEAYRALLERISNLERQQREQTTKKVDHADLLEVENQITALELKLNHAVEKSETEVGRAQVVELTQKKPFYVQLVPKNLTPPKKKTGGKK